MEQLLVDTHTKVLAKKAYTKVKKRNLNDFLTVLAILILLVNPFFKFYRFPIVVITLLLAFQLYNRSKANQIYSPKLLLLFVVYAFIAIVQGIIWKFSLVALFSSFMFGFYIPYLLFISFGHRFFDLLERVVYRLTLLAIIMWLAINFIPGIREVIISLIDALHIFSSDSKIEDNMKRSLIFFTYIYEQKPMSNGLFRNSGFAHEPGAFALFISLAFYFNNLKGLGIFSFRNLIYIVAIITTFSTAGYIAFFLIVLIYLFNSKQRLWAFLMVPLIVYQGYKFYTTADFMQEKINEQIQSQAESDLNNETSGRLYGTRKSLYVLGKYPLYGRGLLSISRPKSSTDIEYASYGFLSEVSRFGLIIGSIGLFYLIRGFIRLSRQFFANTITITLGLISLFVSLSSQVFITNPVIFILFFIGLFKLKFYE